MTAEQVRDLLRRLLESYDNCDAPARGGAVTLKEAGDILIKAFRLKETT